VRTLVLPLLPLLLSLIEWLAAVCCNAFCFRTCALIWAANPLKEGVKQAKSKKEEEVLELVAALEAPATKVVVVVVLIPLRNQ
jgi:hypothetical protein